ncbi:fructosamine kinase [Marinilabiliaceae bacterium JC017]|nr:fructosamine kinase [Marinilabiliaceae bacterium JC017]
MENKLRVQIESIIKELIVSEQTVGGGCIANSRIITTEKGKKYFLKSGFSNNMFIKEANGLNELAKAKATKIPKVIHTTEEFLLLEHVPTSHKTDDCFRLFGHQLAQLHKYRSQFYGFHEDNFIGTNIQPNIPNKKEKNDWPTFYFNKRLLFQFKLAETNNYTDPAFRKLFIKLENKTNEILSSAKEPPSLLHGDLWNGNLMADMDGQPVLIDPAVYYGNREADLAMTRLFGGFSPEFYSSYQQTYPLLAGWEYRLNIYLLYHVLNHLNLFGKSYYLQALSLIKSYIK